MARLLPDITPAKIKLVCTALERGGSYYSAALYAGIAPRTLAKWRQTGREIRDEREKASEESRPAKRLSRAERMYLEAYEEMELARGRILFACDTCCAQAIIAGDPKTALEIRNRLAKGANAPKAAAAAAQARQQGAAGTTVALRIEVVGEQPESVTVQ